MLRHYLTLLLEKAGVFVDRDVQSELCDIDAQLAKVDDLQRRVQTLEAQVKALLPTRLDIGL